MNKCQKCGKQLASSQSLWNHRQRCMRDDPSDYIGRKRPSDYGGTTETRSKNPRIEALANAIINDTKDECSNNLPTNEQKLPSPPPQVVKEAFRKLPSPPPDVVNDVLKVPRTKKDLVGDSEGSDNDERATDNSDSESCSLTEDEESSSDSNDDNDDGDEKSVDSDSSDDSSNDDDERPVLEFLPKSVKGLKKRFNTRFVEFTRQGKHENRNELVALLDEMLRRKAIERDEYKRLNDLIASSLPSTGEEKSKKSTELTSIDGLTDTFIDLYKRFECDGKKQQNIDLLTMLDDLKSRDGISKQSYDILKKRIDWIGKNPIPIVKCVTNEIIESDVNELHKILTGIKVDDERVDRLEKLLSAGDYIDDQPSLPIVLRAIDDLDDLIPKSTLHRLKSLVNDIDKNKYRIVTIFNRLQNGKDKEDEKNILKQLASEELLSVDQYNQFSKLDEIDPRSIAIIIKGTKIGRGLMHLPVRISDLKDTFMKALEEYRKNQHAPTLARLVKLLEELFRQNGISQSKYEAMKKDLNVL